MSLRKGYAVINNALTTVEGSWIGLDYRFDSDGERNYLGNLTSGDTVVVLARGLGYVAGTKPAEYLTVETTIATHTTVSFSGVINGPFDSIRFDKSGASGAANVVAYL
jgi:hypothetical protein